MGRSLPLGRQRAFLHSALCVSIVRRVVLVSVFHLILLLTRQRSDRPFSSLASGSSKGPRMEYDGQTLTRSKIILYIRRGLKYAHKSCFPLAETSLRHRVDTWTTKMLHQTAWMPWWSLGKIYRWSLSNLHTNARVTFSLITAPKVATRASRFDLGFKLVGSR